MIGEHGLGGRQLGRKHTSRQVYARTPHDVTESDAMLLARCCCRFWRLVIRVALHLALHVMCHCGGTCNRETLCGVSAVAEYECSSVSIA
jgi:hypothetical protein